MSELVKTLRNYADSDYLPMHMPGHKRRLGAGEMGDPFFIDITEIEGTDNLHHAEPDFPTIATNSPCSI